MHWGPSGNGERHAKHAGGWTRLRLFGIRALVVDAGIAVASLAKMSLDAELRILEQVFIDGPFPRNRHEPIAIG